VLDVLRPPCSCCRWLQGTSSIRCQLCSVISGDSCISSKIRSGQRTSQDADCGNAPMPRWENLADFISCSSCTAVASCREPIVTSCQRLSFCVHVKRVLWTYALKGGTSGVVYQGLLPQRASPVRRHDKTGFLLMYPRCTKALGAGEE